MKNYIGESKGLASRFLFLLVNFVQFTYQKKIVTHSILGIFFIFVYFFNKISRY